MPHGKPRDPRKEQLWRQRLQLWQRSGLSVSAFCQRYHLALPSFYAWRRTLRLRDAQAATPATPVTFVPVHVRHDHPQPPALLELVLANGRCLRIPHGYDPVQLRQFVQLLEDQPC